MSARNLLSSSTALADTLKDFRRRLTALERRRPEPGGGGGICDCVDGAPGPEGPQGPTGPAGADGATGPTGPAGADGAPGADGADGADGIMGGAVTIPYVFSNLTADADPGAGVMSLDNATQNLATVLRVDPISATVGTAAGTDWSTVIPTFDDSTSTLRGHIRVVANGDQSRWLLFAISAVAAPTGYFNISGTMVGSSAANPFVNGEVVFVCFNRTGDKGDTTSIADAGSALPAFGNAGALTMFKGVVFVDTGKRWWPIGGNMAQLDVESTHFLNNNAQKLELQSGVSGGSANSTTPGAGIMGLLSLDTGTGTTGRAAYSANVTIAMRNNADRFMEQEARVRVPTLSDGTNTYMVEFGWTSSLSLGPSNDGYFFRYDSLTSANWDCVVTNNGARTVVGSGIAVSAATFYKLRIFVDEVNSSAKFYIDDVLKATITTNFPGSTRDYGPFVGIIKSAGTLARQLEVDFVNRWGLLSTLI